MGRQIILLESGAETTAVCMETLERGGFEVIPAKDGADAFRHAAEGHPALVIASLDPQNRTDRLALCRWLKADPRTSQIPALLVGRSIDTDIVRQVTSAGALAVVVLRNDPDKLLSMIRGVFAADDSVGGSPRAHHRGDHEIAADVDGGTAHVEEAVDPKDQTHSFGRNSH